MQPNNHYVFFLLLKIIVVNTGMLLMLVDIECATKEMRQEQTSRYNQNMHVYIYKQVIANNHNKYACMWTHNEIPNTILYLDFGLKYNLFVRTLAR